MHDFQKWKFMDYMKVKLLTIPSFTWSNSNSIDYLILFAFILVLLFYSFLPKYSYEFESKK